MKLMTVSGVFFEIDEESLLKVIKYSWYYNKRDNTVSTVIDGKTTYIHQLLVPGAVQVDHKDRNPLNNKLNNLRSATPQQNQYNKSEYSTNTSGYKGVYWDKSVNKWCSKIRIEIFGVRKLKHLGFFATKELAAIAYNVAARRYHKEFAYQNEVKL